MFIVLFRRLCHRIKTKGNEKQSKERAEKIVDQKRREKHRIKLEYSSTCSSYLRFVPPRVLYLSVSPPKILYAILIALIHTM
jgi:hypothetical protein